MAEDQIPSTASQASAVPLSNSRPRHLRLLSTLSPPSPARTWQTAPHPSLPLAATASSDKTARIYSLQSFSLLETVGGGHRRSVRAVGWKPQLERHAGGGKRGRVCAVLATGSFDASCGIWRRKYPARMTDAKEGNRAGTQPRDNDYNDADDEEEQEDEDEDDEYQFSVLLDGHDSEIKSVAFSPVAPLLATSSRDKSVWLWEDSSTPESVAYGGQEDNFETVAVLAEHEGDVKCVAWHPAEPLLASASYDETVRLWREDDDGQGDDWAECSVIRGHSGTVWCVAWEGTQHSAQDSEDGTPAITKPFPSPHPSADSAHDASDQSESNWRAGRRAAGPRLLSCSDDLTVRTWSRRAPAPTTNGEGGESQHGWAGGSAKVPSILQRTRAEDEDDWRADGELPRVHERAVYAVAWSARSGRVASCGGDGRVVVYEERWRAPGPGKVDSEGDWNMPDVEGRGGQEAEGAEAKATEWVVVAELEAAHGVYEVNHVCWSRRWDAGRRRGGGAGEAEEEILITTGDDGEVKVWTLEEGTGEEGVERT